MAEIKVVHKRRSVWPWVVGLVLVAVVLWMVSQVVARADYQGGRSTARLVKSHPAAVTVQRPGKPPVKAPRPATEEEEALRLRSRVMA